MPEQQLPIKWPFAGLSETFSFSEQEPGTAREYQNVRGLNPRNGRLQGAQRSGLSKYNTSALKASGTKVADLITFFQDNRQVTYSALASGSETVTWAVTTPSKKDCLNVKTDRQGNVYALDGNTGIAKLSADNELLWQLALPTEDANHIVRALQVDEFDVVYAGVSEGGQQAMARMWCYEQLNDNKTEQLWQIETKAYVEDIVIKNDKLYTIQNDVERKRAYVRIYDFFDTANPEQIQEWRVPYPVNSLAVKADGSVFVACEPAGDTTANYWRDPDPKYPNFAPDSVDWTPYQLTDYKKRVWAWYVADDVDETDVASDFSDNVEVLRWRDRTENGRHFFADLGAGDEGPTLAFDACLGHKGVRFSKTGTVQPLQSLRTEPNYSVSRSLAENQRTMIPTYTDSQWFVAMAIRPSATTPDTDNVARWIWGQDRDNAASGSRDHILFLNASDASTVSLPPTADTDQIFWFTGSGGVASGGAGAGGQIQDFTFTAAATDPDVLFTAQLYDGGVGTTGSFFGLNGDPTETDRFTGAAQTSLEPSYLGMFRSFGTKQPTASVSGFLGDVLEIVVLDKKDRNSSTEGVLSHDALETGSGAQSQTATEYSAIIGYLAHKYGCQALLPNSTSSYPHPYGRTGSTPDFLAGPPNQAASTANSAQALANKRFASVVKYTAEGKIVWCANEMATGAESRPGGFGYAVALNSDGNVYSSGPFPTSGSSTVQIRMIVDQGTTFSIATSDGAWSITDATEHNGKHIKIDVDEFDNLYIPHFHSAGSTHSAAVIKKDGTVLHSVDDLAADQQTHAIAVDRRIPDYRNDLTTKRVEHMILATRNESVAANATVHKVRLVSAAQSGASPRTLTTMGVSGGDIKKFTTSAVTTPTGGSAALDSTASYTQSASLFKKVYWTDGRQYKQYDPVTDTITALESTQAGAIPDRCQLIESWRGRLVLARSADEPHNWFLSKKDEPSNFDFFPPVPGETDAVAGNNSPAGLCPDIINTVVPYSEDILVFGCDHSIWMLVGDPAAGGRLELVSDVTGMSFGRPWTKDPSGVLYFFGSQGGVYRWVPGARPERLSLNKIERQLKDVNLSTYFIRLVYNSTDEGIHILQCPFGAGGLQVSHWFLELKTGAFCKDLFGTAAVTNIQPTAIMSIDGDDFDDRLILFGCEDGFVRKWDVAAKSDDTRTDGSTKIAIDSFVTIGPLQGDAEEMAGAEMQFSGLTAILSDTDNGARYELYAAEEPDSLGTVRRNGNLAPGRNPPKWDRVVGPYCWLRLRNAAQEERWAFERAFIHAAQAGMVRPRTVN